MIITLHIDEFLIELFSQLRGKTANVEFITQLLSDYYSYGPYKPKITINDGWASIEIDVATIASQKADFNKVISLCNARNYSAAKPILSHLLSINPSVSDYHRIMGQILSDEGNQDAAVDTLIDALRWDPSNESALIMMGNIQAKHNKDIDTAKKYFDRAIDLNPGNFIALSNFGGMLLREGLIKEAKEYLTKALSVNQDYPNSLYALSIAEDIESDYANAFQYAIQAIKKATAKDPSFLDTAIRQAHMMAQKAITAGGGNQIFEKYRFQLEEKSGKPIDVVEDDNFTPAKIEFAETHNRKYHLIRYNPVYKSADHLKMHELVHLDFILQAQKEGVNQLFISHDGHKRSFKGMIDPFINDLRSKGISDQSLLQYTDSLFHGINLQVFNSPVDLFIEDFLFNEYPELRPWQFFSLHGLLLEGVEATTDKKVVENSPKDILSKSKILNIVMALQFKDLYGIDLMHLFKANKSEIIQANSFWDEYLEYRADREPGEEYDLVKHWGQDLKLDGIFDLVDEIKYRENNSGIDSLLETIENDPLGLESDLAPKERDMDKFQKSQAEIGTNMAVVMYMVDALKFFKDMPLDQVKKIAIEIAMQGTQGYSPSREDYKLHSVPGKKFSGYHILAWYYVSFKLAIPEQLAAIALPFDKEFDIAQTMIKTGK